MVVINHPGRRRSKKRKKDVKAPNPERAGLFLPQAALVVVQGSLRAWGGWKIEVYTGNYTRQTERRVC